MPDIDIAKKHLSGINLDYNQLFNVVLHNSASDLSGPLEGLFYYNTTSKTFFGWNGTTWLDFGAGGSFTIADNSVTNVKLSDMPSGTIKGRLALGNGDPEDLDAAQIRGMINVEDGADVTDSSNVNAAGAVMNSDMTTIDMLFVVDEDDMASDSNTLIPTQQSVKAYVDSSVASMMSSGVEIIGPYDAATNTPDLDATPVGVNKGYLYIVTVQGDFYGSTVYVDDILIATSNNPSSLGDWIVINSDTSIPIATTSDKGIVELSTLAELKAGATDVVPTSDVVKDYVVDVINKGKRESILGDGVASDFVITHNMGSRDLDITVYDLTDNCKVDVNQEFTTINSVTLSFFVPPVIGQNYRVLINRIVDYM